MAYLVSRSKANLGLILPVLWPTVDDAAAEARAADAATSAAATERTAAEVRVLPKPRRFESNLRIAKHLSTFGLHLLGSMHPANESPRVAPRGCVQLPSDFVMFEQVAPDNLN